MITYKFNTLKGVLETYFEGEVVLKEIVDYIIATKQNTIYPRTLKILTNTSEANFNFSPNDLKIIIEENYKSLEKYDRIIDAIITDNPKNTAISMLYQELVKTNKYEFNVFSSKEAALKWLDQF